MATTSPTGVTENAIRRGQVELPGRALPKPFKVDPYPTALAPTLTWQAANAGTSITGSTRRVPWDPTANGGVGGPATDYKFLGVEMALSNSATTGFSNCVESRPLTSPNQSPRGIVEFSTDADKFELFFQCTTASSFRTRLWVDGQPLAWAPAAGFGAGGASYRLLVDFTTVGGRLPRTIRMEWQQARFLGVVAHPTCTIWKTTRNTGPVVAVIGDSFAEGTGAAWWWDGWPYFLGRILGWDVVSLAVGSTGYLAAPAPKVKYRDRLADLPSTYYGLDLVLLSGGYNDASGFSAVPFQAEVQALHAAIVAAYPTTGVLQFGPWWTGGVTTTGTPTGIRDAIVAATLATNTARPGTVVGGLSTVGAVIDPIVYPAGGGWITGGGKVGGTLGNGNADFYVGTDGVHPSPDGHEYLGRRAAAAIIAAGLG